MIDANGFKKPNRLGIDTHYFWVTKSGIIPSGTAESSYQIGAMYCSVNVKNYNNNGSGCAAWIIAKGNMDYLRSTVSW